MNLLIPVPQIDPVPQEEEIMSSASETKHNKSEKLFARAVELMPGGVNSPVRAAIHQERERSNNHRRRWAHIYRLRWLLGTDDPGTC
jgi:hypothetical protein